ncbi:MAG: hypothetical protein PHR16_17570 [Methylovulum sp.]|jgi:hypothetical protein|nr:hypothetical protein [Methylovulum sp.]
MVTQPTKAELQEIDRRLAGAGYTNLTEEGVAWNDRKHANKHAELPDEMTVDDIAVSECPELVGYSVSALRKAAKEVCTYKQRELLNWIIEYPGLSLRDLGNKLGIHNTSVMRRMNGLVNNLQTTQTADILDVLWEVFRPFDSNWPKSLKILSGHMQQKS